MVMGETILTDTTSNARCSSQSTFLAPVSGGIHTDNSTGASGAFARFKIWN